MPMQLLQELCFFPLPLTVSDPDDIEKLAALAAAGLVNASFAKWRDLTQSHSATLLSITPAGRMAVLAMMRRCAFTADSPRGFQTCHPATRPMAIAEVAAWSAADAQAAMPRYDMPTP